MCETSFRLSADRRAPQIRLVEFLRDQGGGRFAAVFLCTGGLWPPVSLPLWGEGTPVRTLGRMRGR